MLIRPKNRHSLLFTAILLILSGCSSDSGTENEAGIDILEDDGSSPAASPAPESSPSVDVSDPELTAITGDENLSPGPGETNENAEPAEPTDSGQQADTDPPNNTDAPINANEPSELEEVQDVDPPNEPTAEDLGAPSLSESLNDSVTSFVNVLEDVVAESLVEMNGRLQSGEDLDPVQSTCLGTFDPAFGEALAAIECGAEQLPISVSDFSMFLASGAVARTSICNDGLLGLDGNDCRLTNADLLLPVEWSTPAGSLPQPFASGFMEYNLEPNLLRIFSLENSVTPAYNCSFDLSNATVESELTFGNCNAELDRLRLRLEAWLDRR